MKYKKYFRKTSLKQKGVGDFFLNEVLKVKPKTFLEIGNENIIREGVTINRGTTQEDSLTKIGSKNLISAKDVKIGATIIYK